MLCGVYVIKNTVNSKLYVGSSINVKQRFRSHKSLLVKGNHSNNYLQNSWDLHGSDSFEFSLIEECEANEDVLLNREQFWLDHFSSCDHKIGYNLVKDVVRNSGWHHTDEAKLKIGIASKKKKNRTWTKEEREEVGKRTKGKTYEELYGEKSKVMIDFRSRSYEDRFGKELSEKLKASKRGTFESIHGKEKALKIRKKMSNARVGKSHISDEGIESLRQSKLGMNNPNYLPVDSDTRMHIVQCYKESGIVTKKMIETFGISRYKIKKILKEENNE